jgi:hypothetical protein
LLTCQKFDDVKRHYEEPHGDIGGSQRYEEVVLDFAQRAIVEHGHDHKDISANSISFLIIFAFYFFTR